MDYYKQSTIECNIDTRKYNILQTNDINNVIVFKFDEVNNYIQLLNHPSIAIYCAIFESKQRYLFIPCKFEYLETHRHITSIIFDKYTNNVYLFDCNGYACFYDALLDRDVVDIIDGLMKRFCETIPGGYKYINCRDWSSNDTVIHHPINGYPCCVGYTILFLNALSYTQLDITEVITYISGLDKDSLQKIMKKYLIILRPYILIDDQEINKYNLCKFIDKFGELEN